MYDELIKRLHPKPVFNLKWYKNEDFYSEGEVEDRIIQIIAEHEPEDYVEAIKNNFSWSTFYHLTHTRKNILNWYTFDKEASVLEIGCGMGAVTGVLCEHCKEVTAVELSKRRALGTLLRCREKENLEIIVGNLNDIHFEKKYDYITLIGVLEYQGSYTDGENPYADFLKKVKGLLKPEGKLLIAIENQYGLKYWCGAREDHTGLPFEGMNQYRLSNRKVRTFSKKDLDILIKDCGFKKIFFYYPMPDYKLPTVIYSQKYLPKNENMLNMSYYYIPDAATLVASEKEICKDIINNQVFDFFANSFLVECTQEGTVGEVIFASLSSKRMIEYQVGTRITQNSEVEKFALGREKRERHLEQILLNEREMKKVGLNVVGSQRKADRITAAYMDCPTLEEVILEYYYKKDKEGAYGVWDMLYDQILRSSVEVSNKENILYSFGIDMYSECEKYGVILKIGYLDMILRNAFYQDEKIIWFDQEWTLENVPAKYVMYRAINQFYHSFNMAEKVIPMSILAQRYQLLAAWNKFTKLESLFIQSVIDSTHFAEGSAFERKASENIVMNIRRLINKGTM